jgi:cyclophilin family peptidyl-prolyl cis-trans isomerase
MIKWIYIFFFLFSTFSTAKELDYSIVANKNYDSKYHFFYSKELKSNLLAFQKKDSTIALYQYMSDRKWKPISNAKAYDGFPKAENIFPNMKYDKKRGVIAMGKMVKVKSPLSMDKKNIKMPNSVLVMKTTQGEIGLELFDSLTPKTVENFLFLANNKLYDGLIFHRVIDDFMIQGGDPSGNGTGSMSKWGTKFKDEFVDTLKFDKPYLLAMANSGPNTNGSQFFITLNAEQTKHLTGKHTIFGRVIYGFKVVDKIAKIKTNDSDAPIIKQEMISIRMNK